MFHQRRRQELLIWIVYIKLRRTFCNFDRLFIFKAKFQFKKESGHPIAVFHFSAGYHRFITKSAKTAREECIKQEQTKELYRRCLQNIIEFEECAATQSFRITSNHNAHSKFFCKVLSGTSFPFERKYWWYVFRTLTWKLLSAINSLNFYLFMQE